MQKNKNELQVIEKQFNRNIFSLVHLARKAGRVTMGFGAVKSSMIKGKTRVILIAEDIAENTLKKIMSDEFAKNIDKLVFSNKDDIAKELQIKEVALISINDINFANGIFI